MLLEIIGLSCETQWTTGRDYRQAYAQQVGRCTHSLPCVCLVSCPSALIKYLLIATIISKLIVWCTTVYTTVKDIIRAVGYQSIGKGLQIMTCSINFKAGKSRYDRNKSQACHKRSIDRQYSQYVNRKTI